MNKYIDVKLISAVSMKKKHALSLQGYDSERDTDGYKVMLEDGHTSWSPKEVFEKAYMKIIPNPRLKTDISISQTMVDDFIKEVHVSTIGDKTTLVRVILANGFEIIESSACVDKENYSEEIGGEVCLGKIKNKVWMLLGFLLQTAVGGIK